MKNSDSPINSHQQTNRHLINEYISRVNRVLDFIENNIDNELSLKQLADIANFSPFHFHRLFKGLMGETLNQYIKRIRTEKAAALLLRHPNKTITDIAYDCGFSSSAAFARTFRELFSTSPRSWRTQGKMHESKIRQTDSKKHQMSGNIRKDITISFIYTDSNINQLKWRITMNTKSNLVADVKLKDCPELNVAYVRHIGPYKGDNDLFEGLFNKLMMWAGPRNLIRPPHTKILTVYHDDPEITEEDKLRTSACITVPEGTKTDGEIGTMIIPGGKFAVARFELANDQYEDAWNAVFGGWLPESGYQPDDRLCYELYQNNPKEHPQQKCVVDICIPVRPL